MSLNRYHVFLDACTLKGDDYKNLHPISPYADVVSFESQQRRAINTILALKEGNCISENQEVAVIGGGLAGITAAATLARYGCKVTLFEKENDVLPNLYRANHRWIHPTTNFWPFREHLHTTEFPFLNWRANWCDQIVKSLRRDWRIHFSSPEKNITPNTSVQVMKVESRRDKVVIKAEGRFYDDRDKPIKKTLEFDLAVIATGFAPEISLPKANSKSYWDPDELNEKMKDPNNRVVIISGIGDGGLIDVLRVIYENFSGGNLTSMIIESINRLDDALEVIDQVKKIERAGADYIPAASEGYPRIARLLKEKKYFREMLSFSNFDHDKEITLIGDAPSVFAGNAAPIHKLLIAYAMVNDRLQFVHSKTEKIESQCLIISEDKSGIRKVNKDYCVIRHGSKEPHPIIEILASERKEKEKLSAELNRKKILNQYLCTGEPIIPQKLFSLNDVASYPCPKTRPLEFVLDTFGELAKYLDHRGIKAEVSPKSFARSEESFAKAEECGYGIKIYNDRELESSGYYIVKRFYGLQVIWRNQELGDLTKGKEIL